VNCGIRDVLFKHIIKESHFQNPLTLTFKGSVQCVIRHLDW